MGSKHSNTVSPNSMSLKEKLLSKENNSISDASIPLHPVVSTKVDKSITVDEKEVKSSTVENPSVDMNQARTIFDHFYVANDPDAVKSMFRNNRILLEPFIIDFLIAKSDAAAFIGVCNEFVISQYDPVAAFVFACHHKFEKIAIDILNSHHAEIFANKYNLFEIVCGNEVENVAVEFIKFRKSDYCITSTIRILLESNMLQAVKFVVNEQKENIGKNAELFEQVFTQLSKHHLEDELILLHSIFKLAQGDKYKYNCQWDYETCRHKNLKVISYLLHSGVCKEFLSYSSIEDFGLYSLLEKDSEDLVIECLTCPKSGSTNLQVISQDFAPFLHKAQQNKCEKVLHFLNLMKPIIVRHNAANEFCFWNSIADAEAYLLLLGSNEAEQSSFNPLLDFVMTQIEIESQITPGNNKKAKKNRSNQSNSLIIQRLSFYRLVFERVVLSLPNDYDGGDFSQLVKCAHLCALWCGFSVQSPCYQKIHRLFQNAQRKELIENMGGKEQEEDKQDQAYEEDEANEKTQKMSFCDKYIRSFLFVLGQRESDLPYLIHILETLVIPEDILLDLYRNHCTFRVKKAIHPYVFVSSHNSNEGTLVKPLQKVVDMDTIKINVPESEELDDGFINLPDFPSHNFNALSTSDEGLLNHQVNQVS